ncbi:hypothetical protein IWQ51_001671 [Labrenzia sp. EL_142]|nr:hypothetical protein [Labrenzia sp. EL_142]
MNYLSHVLALFSVLVASCALAEEPGLKSGHLILPAQGTEVDLQTGAVSRKGVTGQCLETVSHAGGSRLVVSRNPGDDVPNVTVNGTIQSWVSDAAGAARLGSVRLARDGSLALLRTWKTGDKQTELLQDGQIVRKWERAGSPKILRFTEHEAIILESGDAQSWHLKLYPRNLQGRIEPRARTLVDFGSCRPGRMRIDEGILWAQMDCGEGTDGGIFRIDMEKGEIGAPLLISPTAEFATIPGSAATANGQTVAVVSGTPAALQLYYAATGLLLSQSGEVRACASDAEGLQSWNQSYRLRSLSTLFRKTGDEAFAALALKSMRLTLAAQDGKQGRAGISNPECGWSSTIYGQNADERLSLMINQAMIANALDSSCRKLGKLCPPALSRKITASNLCLARAYEEDFDTEAGIYTINARVDFRFAGKFAPWNWQIAFAALLSELPDADYKARARQIVQAFLKEWQSDKNGGLWRYWPSQYYLEKGLTGDQLGDQRFEDTGHAGITLLTLSDFTKGLAPETADLVKRRLDYILSFGKETPRDLDGDGPAGHRWFPAGGWSHYATEELQLAYEAPVPGRFSADSLYVYSRLFDPAARFQLTIDFHSCRQTCQFQGRQSFSSWQSFLKSNPFFLISTADTDVSTETKQEVRGNTSKIHNQ